eukprot:CAMPEP_0115134100 /NCGR_PEP_ID=MMETSP0227-20121206/54876_1 /TAXON_ID=89957 /ORGANISM="Polarella glacialis, Strain CCMP 1383" /LENGTH=314 /DNA_ID=CAMNT_0002540477 /DNA_START=48 /DNA_END=988 /DNA_ORIENTATION=-
MAALVRRGVDSAEGLESQSARAADGHGLSHSAKTDASLHKRVFCKLICLLASVIIFGLCYLLDDPQSTVAALMDLELRSSEIANSSHRGQEEDRSLSKRLMGVPAATLPVADVPIPVAVGPAASPPAQGPPQVAEAPVQRTEPPATTATSLVTKVALGTPNSSLTLHEKASKTSLEAQVATPVSPASAGKCLSFIHIPKNGGSTIEYLYAQALRNESLKLTQPLEWGDCGAAQRNGKRYWGMCDKGLTCETKKKCEMSVADCCWVNKSFSPLQVPPWDSCSFWHLPPAWDSQLAESYRQCDTFCVVRDPIAKFV